ncbi:hypothetical protein F511_21433 [Dorcoceras hygrometricum]|uniref:Uncharacterized protein n=1 Tax=Dorcoceras hygrometricum TaxID=472368 RepID=A0A2Z7C8M1_9LAMI|nr:hypothetical protein F511_21433 [Dorcoceras hygrometricum]
METTKTSSAAPPLLTPTSLGLFRSKIRSVLGDLHPFQSRDTRLCDDSADHHKAVVFRHDDSADHHIKNSVGPFRHDDSAGRSQAKEFSSQRKHAQYIQATVEVKSPTNSYPTAKTEVPQIWPQLSLTYDYAISDMTLQTKHAFLIKTVSRYLTKRRSIGVPLSQQIPLTLIQT